MKPRETKDRSMQRANTQIPLRCSSPASSEAQPDHCRKDVQEVGNQRHSQWHPVSKHREGHPQCVQYPPKRNLGESSSTWRKEKGEEERIVPSGSNPDALRKKREGGAEEGYQTLVNRHVDLASMVRRLSV